MKTFARGVFSGILANVAMSLVLVVGKALGLLGTPPPKTITARMSRKMGIRPERTPRLAFNAGWLAAHLGYGAGCGVVYVTARSLLPRSNALSGLLYGLAVWAVSYLGLLSKLGLYPPADRDSPSRQVVMVAAHLVFGSTLGFLGPEKQDPARRPVS